MNTKHIATAPKPLLWLAAPVIAAALTACGGGGGGSTAAPAPAPAPAPADCVAKTVTDGACQFSIPATKFGASSSVDTSSSGYKGTVSATCGANATFDVKTTTACGLDQSHLALQTSVPTPTYAQSSAAAAAFDLLNRQRGKCGFGLVSQSALLDKSATNHGNYVAQLNNSDLVTYYSQPHIETAGMPGFTGVSVIDRAVNTGYATTGQNFHVIESESLGVYSISSDGKTTISESGMGFYEMRNQLATVRHMAALMGPYREIGFGTPRLMSVAYPGSVFGGVVADLGFVTDQQFTQDLVSFPCDGVTDVSASFNGESPNPLAGTNLKFPLGTPIMFAAASGADGVTMPKPKIIIKTATVTGSGKTYSTADGTLYVHTVADNSVFLLPTTPLANSTSYTVNATVSVNGVDSTRTFTFTTDDNLLSKFFNGPVPQ